MHRSKIDTYLRSVGWGLESPLLKSEDSAVGIDDGPFVVESVAAELLAVPRAADGPCPSSLVLSYASVAWALLPGTSGVAALAKQLGALPLRTRPRTLREEEQVHHD